MITMSSDENEKKNMSLFDDANAYCIISSDL